MAIAATMLLEEASTTGGDPVTTAGSITTVAGRLYIATILSSSTATVVSVTLPGSLATASIGVSTRGSLFTVSSLWAIATAGNTGTVTVDMSAAADGSVVIVDEITGHDATTPIVAASFKAANGASATTATVTMNAFADAVNNAGYFASAINGNVAMTPEGGWTELGQGAFATPTRAAMSQWKLGGSDTSPSSTFAASQWSCLAFEIAAAAAVNGIPSLVTARSRR